MRERGAAERALLWHVYLAEEIHKTKFTIAANGCGTRTGLQNQKNRLDLDEFVRYIWMSTDDKDKLPPKNTYAWSVKIEDAPKMSHVEIAKAISSIKCLDKTNFSKHGFMGNLNTLNVNGEGDWFECMKKIKESIGQVINALNANDVDNIDHNARAQIVWCVEEAQEGCRRVIDLRRKKIWQHVRSDMKDGLDIQNVAPKSHTGLAKGEEYNRPSRKQTFDNDREVWTKFDADFLKFSAKWKEVLYGIKDFLDGDEHLEALEIFEKLHVDITEIAGMQHPPFISFAEELDEIARGLDD